MRQRLTSSRPLLTLAVTHKNGRRLEPGPGGMEVFVSRGRVAVVVLSPLAGQRGREHVVVCLHKRRFQTIYAVGVCITQPIFIERQFRKIDTIQAGPSWTDPARNTQVDESLVQMVWLRALIDWTSRSSCCCLGWVGWCNGRRRHADSVDRQP